MKKTQVQEPKATIESIVIGGVEYRADGVKTVLYHPLPDGVEDEGVEAVATSENRTIRYIVLGDGTRIG